MVRELLVPCRWVIGLQSHNNLVVRVGCSIEFFLPQRCASFAGSLFFRLTDSRILPLEGRKPLLTTNQPGWWKGFVGALAMAMACRGSHK